MIQINFVSSAGVHATYNVPATDSIRDFFEANNINYHVGVTSLDGAPLQAGQMDMTFEDFNITDSCWLTVVVKADNA